MARERAGPDHVGLGAGVPEAEESGWGWLAPISLTSASGIFFLALASAAGHSGSRWADLLFWIGLLMLCVPTALRLLAPFAPRHERISLLVMLYGALFLDRDLNYPLGFAYNDEFDWFRVSQDVATTGHLFHASPLLGIGPFYPGLAIVISTIKALTGLPLFGCAVITLFAAGLVLVLSLYLFFEYVSGSGQIAGIATLIYAADPPFSGNIQILYGALAIPLAAFVLFLVVFRREGPRGSRIGLTLAIWCVIATVAITHHVTSYELAGFLLVWTGIPVCFWFLRVLHLRGPWTALLGPGEIGLVAVLLCVVWTQITADRAFYYLWPSIQSTASELLRVLSTHHSQRHFFRDAAGVVEPRWERYAGLLQVILIAAGLPFGLWAIWRRFPKNTAALVLAIAAAGYPLDQLARLAPDGTTTGSRSDAYVYVAVGFVLSVAISYFFAHRLQLWWWRFGVTGVVTAIFIGGWVLGTSPIWDRLPGPYVVAAQERSIDPEGVQAAEWARSHLGPGHLVVTDRTNDLLMGTYGDQWVVQSTSGKHILIWPVFLMPNFGHRVKETIRGTGIQYVVVDTRLTTGLPHQCYYYDPYEPNSGSYTSPVNPRVLEKFDKVKMVNRIFDSGQIHIYDVRAFDGK